MNDSTCTIENLKNEMRTFIKERKWESYHNPKNISMSIAIEAAELMELFQWIDKEDIKELTQDSKKMTDIEDEVADVFCYLMSFVSSLDIDLTEAVLRKIVKNRKKYPTSIFQGNYEKVKL